MRHLLRAAAPFVAAAAFMIAGATSACAPGAASAASRDAPVWYPAGPITDSNDNDGTRLPACSTRPVR